MLKFSLLITNWYRQNCRELPWRETSDPYKIWLSEIILQQTRVDQGLAYYLKFIKNYPTVIDLANASEDAVLNDWQGLGYYSRARNLHFSAQLIRDQYDGQFPDSYTEILKLKGVGKYTAAAIASFAFQEKKAVVDGNVYRLLSRVFNIHTAIDSTKGQKDFQTLADELIPDTNPDEHNQAIMELGALVCTPTQPKCPICPLQDICESKAVNQHLNLPIKSKKIKVRNRYFHYLIYLQNNKTVIEKRTSKDIWQNLYQFPLIETTEDNLTAIPESIVYRSEKVIHKLSHQHIHARFYHIAQIPKKTTEDQIVIEISKIQEYPLPRIIDRYLENNTFEF